MAAQTSVAVRELRAGMRHWRKNTNWPCDFHNQVYAELAAAAPTDGFTDAWWEPFLARLRAWRATRPLSDAVLTVNFESQAADLDAAWASCAFARDGHDITAVHWPQVAALPEVAAAVKPTKSRSPVFPSKFCHFLMPQVFPVYDRTAVGGRWKSYEAYFDAVQSEWAATSQDDRRSLIEMLTAGILAQPDVELTPEYPFANKVVELRLIGRRHPEV